MSFRALPFMFIYVYCDIFSFHRADVIDGILAGKIGLLMAIPSLMAIVTVRAKAGLARAVNLAVSRLYFLVNVGNLASETWSYYWLYGTLELGIAAFILVTALRLEEGLVMVRDDLPSVLVPEYLH
jgi:hypothetical protein